MLQRLSEKWWAMVLRGVAAVLFALGALLWPGITLTVLILFFGAYALVDGIIALAAAFAPDKTQRWWVLLLEGLVGIGVGILAFVWPGLTAVALLYLIAAWAIATGVLEIMAAIRLRKVIEGEWLLGLAGLASIALGVLFVLAPGAGLLVWVWMLGGYALFFGVVLIALGLRLRRYRQESAQGQPKYS